MEKNVMVVPISIFCIIVINFVLLNIVTAVRDEFRAR
jgi:hypothetical protein